MRMRTISPQIWANEDLGSMGGDGVLLFVGMWMLADREGRLKDRPRWIGAQIFPYRDVPVEDLLNELSAHGFVNRYEAEGGRYLEIVNFRKYQKPHANETVSRIPPNPVEQCTKSRQPLTQIALNNGENGFPSDSLRNGFSENGESECLTDAHAAQTPAAPDDAPTPEKPASNRIGQELARLQSDAEDRWPKRGAIEQGMDEIRAFVGTRASPVEALIEVRRGFEVWVRAIPDEGLPADAVNDWPNLETWARKRLWKDPPRRVVTRPRAGPQVVLHRDLREQVAQGMAMSRKRA